MYLLLKKASLLDTHHGTHNCECCNEGDRRTIHLMQNSVRRKIIGSFWVTKDTKNETKQNYKQL